MILMSALKIIGTFLNLLVATCVATVNKENNTDIAATIVLFVMAFIDLFFIWFN